METLLERFITLQTRPDAVRTEELRGQSFTVIPAIGLVEGVLRGANSNQAELALADEFGDVPAAWDGRPVTLGHPQRDGTFVSANRPDVFETETVGFMFNTQRTGEKAQKLKTELWIDQSRMPRAEMDRLMSGKEVEVSTGFFADSLPFPGEFGGQEYESILVNIKPDHLAILAEGTLGACSFADGCGAPRVNMTKDQLKAAVLASKLKAKGKHEDDEDDKDNKGKKKTAEKDAKSHPKKNSADCACADAGKCACQTVKDNKGTEVNLKSQSQGKGTRPDAINKVVTGLEILSEGENTMNKDDLIAKVIAAEANAFAESDLATLAKLTVESLKGILAADEGAAAAEGDGSADAAAAVEAPAAAAEDDAAAAAAAAATDEGNAGQDEAEVSTDPPTLADYIAAAPAEIAQVLSAGVRQLSVKQSKLMAEIKANKANTFTDVEMKAMSLEDLAKLAKFAKVQDFSGKGGPKANAGSDLNVPKTYLEARTGAANPFLRNGQ